MYWIKWWWFSHLENHDMSVPLHYISKCDLRWFRIHRAQYIPHWIQAWMYISYFNMFHLLHINQVPIYNEHNALKCLWCILVTKFSPTCFSHYCSHIQGGDIITRIQRYKCGKLCGRHSITIKNYYNFSYNYISNIKRGNENHLGKRNRGQCTNNFWHCMW